MLTLVNPLIIKLTELDSWGAQAILTADCEFEFVTKNAFGSSYACCGLRTDIHAPSIFFIALATAIFLCSTWILISTANKIRDKHGSKQLIHFNQQNIFIHSRSIRRSQSFGSAQHRHTYIHAAAHDVENSCVDFFSP